MRALCHADSRTEDDKQAQFNETNGITGQLKYDPDLAHPAAGYGEDNLSSTTPPLGVSERRLVTKIDFRVVPVLSILYLLAFLDRTNTANAAVFGLQADLKLKGTQ